MKIKICGITNREDYQRAVELGADYIGFIFYPGSPRNVDLETVMDICRDAPAGHKTVGVFVNRDIETIRWIYNRVCLDIVQLHGDETPEFVGRLGVPCWKALRVKDRSSLVAMRRYECSGFLLDNYEKGKYGGTGKSFDIALLEEAARSGQPVIASGGISEDNVSSYREIKFPVAAVDVNSSIESEPGKKDHNKMKRLFDAFNRNERIGNG